MAHSRHTFPGREDLYTSMQERLHEIRRSSRSEKGVITRYVLNTRNVRNDEKLKREVFGEQDKSKPHRTILMVGETRTEKSSIINGMVNYMLGVESKDRCWFEIVETRDGRADSQTNAVAVYEVSTEHTAFSLTVIDVPGFRTTKDVEEVGETLQELFRFNNHVDAVCLLVPAVTAQLGQRQLYVFDAVLSLLSSDVEKNIVMFITRASRKPSSTIKAIVEAKVPCAQTDEGEPVYFRFDICHCENFDDEEILEDYEASWHLLNKTMDSFLIFLNESKAISLKMTQTVLKNRKQLISSISNIKDRITLTELRKNELEQAEKALQQLEREKTSMDNFQYEADEPYKVKVPIENQWWDLLTTKATCCEICKENCHYPGCWWVENLSWCSVMSKNGKCTVCTGRCDYTAHVKDREIYVTKTRRVKKTMEDLKRKYETKSGETKSLVSQLKDAIKREEIEKLRLVEECYRCVVVLEGIALKSDSGYTLHLDFLLEKVKETGNADWVQKLEEVKRRAVERKERKGP